MSKAPLVWEWTTSAVLLTISVLAERFKTKSQFQLPKSYLPNFEHIASTRSPPYDPRALTERRPDPPVRDCGAWVAEVLEEVRAMLRNEGLDV
jgi:hypothetical protein